MAQSAYVLIVDDDPDIRAVFAEMLTGAGHRVATAAQGSEAIQSLCSGAETPDLILLDLAMPGMDGLEFRKLQRQYVRLASIPVVVVSAFASPDMAAQLDVAAVLVKPLAPSALLDAVERYRRPASP